MKKLLSLLLCLTIFAPLPAMADTDLTSSSIANGVVSAVSWYDVTAPFSGTLLGFELVAGDAVNFACQDGNGQ